MTYKRKYKISESEWLILNVIWEKSSPVYMKDIVRALGHRPWSRTTIQTMVTRLVQKGIVGTIKSGYAFEYYSIPKKDEVLKEYTEFFVNRVYNSDASALIENIVEGGYLTAEDKRELKRNL